MKAPLAVALTVAAIAVLGAIARERTVAYRLRVELHDWRAYAVIVAALAACAAAGERGGDRLTIGIVVATAAVAAITDLQSGYVFDRVLLAGAIASILATFANGHPFDAVCGAAASVIGVGLPWALTAGRGMGFADVKLAAVLGWGLGLRGALHALWFAFLLGGIAAAGVLVVRGRRAGNELPFAPFLALGAALCVAGA
jgi:leader peptidase (prepilin peptidase)/N-methyltransferase